MPIEPATAYSIPLRVYVLGICDAFQASAEALDTAQFLGNRSTHILHLAVETAATQTKPAYAGYKILALRLVRVGGLGMQ